MAGTLRKDHAVAAIVLGAMEIVFGLIITICSFAVSSKANMTASLTPYWAGIAFIIPGIIGVACGATKNRCAMIAFMVVNIIAFIIEGLGFLLIAFVLAVWSALASHLDDCSYSSITKTCICTVNGKLESVGGLENCDALTTISTLLTVLFIFLILAALITLASSILGCIAVCCTQKNNPQTVIIQHPGMVMQSHGNPNGNPNQQQQAPPYENK